MTEAGVAIVEIGATQAVAVLALAEQAGLFGSVRRDLAGLDRCVVLRR
jgi:release factor glutamine methyltransferase